MPDRPVPDTGETGRRTRRVTFTVDTPGDVTDAGLAEVFAQMWVDAPVMPGWWVSTPEVNDAPYLSSPGTPEVPDA